MKKRVYASLFLPFYLGILAAGHVCAAQQVAPPEQSTAYTPDSIPKAVALVGLVDIEPRIGGALKLTNEGVNFTTANLRSDIPYQSITTV